MVCSCDTDVSDSGAWIWLRLSENMLENCKINSTIMIHSLIRSHMYGIFGRQLSSYVTCSGWLCSWANCTETGTLHTHTSNNLFVRLDFFEALAHSNYLAWTLPLYGNSKFHAADNVSWTSGRKWMRTSACEHLIIAMDLKITKMQDLRQWRSF